MPKTDSYYDLIHSPDDGGWYAELYDFGAMELHTTDVKSTELGAVIAVKDWAALNGYTPERLR